MRIPGWLWIALIAGVTALLDGLLTGLSGLGDVWAPVAVAGLGAILRWIEVEATHPPEFVVRDLDVYGGEIEAVEVEQRSKVSRFLWGD